MDITDLLGDDVDETEELTEEQVNAVAEQVVAAGEAGTALLSAAVIEHIETFPLKDSSIRSDLALMVVHDLVGYAIKHANDDEARGVADGVIELVNRYYDHFYSTQEATSSEA